MEIGECHDFMTFGHTLHHIVAAVFATTDHSDHTHLDDDGFGVFFRFVSFVSEDCRCLVFCANGLMGGRQPGSYIWDTNTVGVRFWPSTGGEKGGSKKVEWRILKERDRTIFIHLIIQGSSSFPI